MNVTIVKTVSATYRVDNSTEPDRTTFIAADVTVGENQPVNIQNGSLSNANRPGASCSFWRSYGSTHVDFNGYGSFEEQVADHILVNDFIASVEGSNLIGDNA